jgi:hypothetical protein
MKTFKEFNEDVSNSMFKNVEAFADRLFKDLEIDVEFTKHFKDRVNDNRNHPDITGQELLDFFKAAFKKHGEHIKFRGEGTDAILNQINTDLNMPFVLKWDKQNNELDLVAKTIMRTKKFLSHGQRIMRF